MSTKPRQSVVTGAAETLLGASSADAEPVKAASQVQGGLDSSEEVAGLAAWEDANRAMLAAWEEERRVVAAWIEQNRDALPTDYDELARLPSAYRGAVLLVLAPEHASALLQEHLRRSVAARPDMTAAQREVIAQAQQIFTPAWCAGSQEMHAATWQGSFSQSMGDAFSVAERIRIFGSIGPEDDDIHRRIAEATAPPLR